MTKIDLQKKANTKKGVIEIYYFENRIIERKKTLFHRIFIPLEPFNSGLEYESQPVETEIIIEWLNLNLKEPTNLDGVKLSSIIKNDVEVSIYIGNVHNRCEVTKMEFEKIEDNNYNFICDLLVCFEQEGIALDEEYNFSTELILDKEIKE